MFRFPNDRLTGVLRPGMTARAALVTACLLLSTGLCADEWYRLYDRGEKCLKRGDTHCAAAAFEAALAERPQPGRKMRAHGMRFMDYFPHLKLGESYIQMERWAEARLHLEASQNAAAAPGSEIQRLLERVAAAEKLLASAGSMEPEKPLKSPVSAPSGVRATVSGEGGEYRLTWNRVESAAAYLVQEKAGDVSWPESGGVSTTEAAAVFPEKSGGRYRCRVRAMAANGNFGPWSDEVLVTIAVGAEEIRTARSRFGVGHDLMKRGDFLAAIGPMKEAVAVLEDKAEWMALLGCCHAALHFLKNDQGHREEAGVWFRRALAADDSYRLDENLFSPKIITFFETQITGG